MAITDPQAIKFLNEVVRPLCEQVRAQHAKTGDASTSWYGGINTLFPNTAEVVDDGRASEGISVLTGANVNSVMSILLAMDAQYNSEIITKPCVRPITAS